MGPPRRSQGLLLAGATGCPLPSRCLARSPRTAGRGRPPARPPSEVRERRRRDLLDAAYSVIAEKGLEGLRTRDIAARAGVNIATLHYYFASKEELLVAVIRHVPERFLAGAVAPPAPERSLRAHLERAFGTFRANPELNTVLQELTVRAHRDPAARFALRAIHDQWNGTVEDILRRAIADGAVREDLDVRTSARIVTSFVMGAFLQLGVNGKAFDFTELARSLEEWMGSRSRSSTSSARGVRRG